MEMDGSTGAGPQPVRHGTGEFSGVHGVNIFYQTWIPETPKAVLVVAHGGAEHSGRYEHMARRFARKGYAVYALDHRGLGRSGGVRGDVEKFEYYLDDLETFAKLAKGKHPGLKAFLVGHSIGGLLVLGAAARNSGVASGVVASSPCLDLSMKVPPAKAALGRLLARIAPTLALDNGIPSDGVSRDPAVVEAYNRDPLRYGKVTARFFVELTRGMEMVRGMAGQLAMPSLIMQAGDDKLVSKDATIRFYEGIRFPDKEFRLWEGFYHELFNEPEKEQVFKVVDEWLEKRA